MPASSVHSWATDVRLLLAIPSLRCGGAERVMSILASHWVKQGHEVSLATFDPPATDFFAVDPAVRRFVIGGSGSHAIGWASANRRRMAALRGVIRETRPEVVVSFLYTMNLLAILAGRRLAPVIVAERTDPRHSRIERWQAVLRRALYPAAAAVVVQTSDVLDGWARHVTRRSRAFAIPNPVLPPTGSEWLGPPLPRPFIASIGRLDRAKGFDALLESFAAVVPEHPDWSLVILGDGPEREALRAQAQRLGVDARILLAGVGDAGALLADAEVYVSASRVEGFPNALLEAMASGVVVVATDCSSGPREIIRPEVDGLLVDVDDSGAMAAALALLMRDPDLRRRLGDGGRAVVDRFGLERVAAEWEAVFATVKRHTRR